MKIRELIIQEAKVLIKNSLNNQKNDSGLNQEYTFNNSFNHLIKHSVTGAITGGLGAAYISSRSNDNGEINPNSVAAGAMLGSTVSGLAGAVLGPAMSYGLRKYDELMDRKIDKLFDKMFNKEKTKQ